MLPPRGSTGTQHGLSASAGWRSVYQSLVHSHVFPVISKSPYGLGGKDPTGAVPSNPSSHVLRNGNSPCHQLASSSPPGDRSSPQAYSAPSIPPRAARSHSASVGNSLPAQVAYAVASSKATWTTGWSSRPAVVLPGPSGWRQLAPGVQAHQLSSCGANRPARESCGTPTRQGAGSRLAPPEMRRDRGGAPPRSDSRRR